MTAYLKTITDELYVKAAFTTEAEAYQQGQAAGDEAFAIEQNPYPVGSLHDKWKEGHEWSTKELCGK